MKKIISSIILLFSVINCFALIYNGVTLKEISDFTRTQTGTTDRDIIKEVSGLAASLTTPGYLWAESDEDNSRIMALKPDGTLGMTLKLTGASGRDDWEDICTGYANGKNIVFIGAFGDNNLIYKDNYYIYWFEEPAISSGTKTIAVNKIKFGFPDGAAHNVETLMFDTKEQMLYIVDKAENVAPTVYSLPFKTDYTGLQTMSTVCRLGLDGEKFDQVTGGDITSNGSRVVIKNKKHILLWERDGNESISETLKRQPVEIGAYKKEEQGEAVAWTVYYTLYTTSDSKMDTPIYKYQSTVKAGDANEDGIIDVADITAIAAYILGSTPVYFNEQGADANKDGIIDVADITATAGIILGTSLVNEL